MVGSPFSRGGEGERFRRAAMQILAAIAQESTSIGKAIHRYCNVEPKGCGILKMPTAPPVMCRLSERTRRISTKAMVASAR